MEHYTPEENPFELVDGKMVRKDRMTTDRFISKSRYVHKDRYTYENAVYTKGTDDVIVTCKVHGDFKVPASSHLVGTGCRRCNGSKGERAIMHYLDTHGIDFEFEKTFEGCRNPATRNKLRYDFYLPKYNFLIEFDGRQHFPPSEHDKHYESKYWKWTYVNRLDIIKNNFARDNGIDLLRIPYTQIKDVEKLLDLYIPSQLSSSDIRIS